MTSNYLQILRICKLQFIILLFLWIGPSIYAQSNTVDSLGLILEQDDLKDSTRIQVTFEIIDLIYFKDPPKCLNLLINLDQMIHSSTVENKFKHKFSLARAYSQTYKPDTAEILLNQAVSLVPAETFPREYAMAYSLLGIIQEQKGNLPKAVECYKIAAPVFFELKDSFKYAAALNNMGIVYELQANYTAALEAYLKALPIFQKLEVQRGVVSIYNNIGLIKQKQKSFNEALIYFKKVLAISKSSGNKNREAQAFNDIGAMYMDLDQLDSASYYLHTSGVLYEGIENDHGVSTINNNLGKLYRLNKDYQKAIQYNIKAHDYAARVKALKPMIFALLELGYCHQNLKNISKANVYFNEALTRAKTMEEISLQFRIENALYKLHRNTNVAKSLMHYENATTFRDSMLNKTKIEELKTIELNYEFDKERLIRDQEIKTLKVEDRLKSARLKNQNYTITFLVLFLLSAFVLSKLVWNNYKKNKALTEQENELQKQRIVELERERKIMAMSSMIEGQESERKRIAQDLHDGLGGLLATIKLKFGIIQKEIAQLETLNVYQQTTTMIDEACSEVRKIAHNMMPDSLSKLGLIEAVRDIAEYSSGLNVKVINLGIPRLSETQEIMVFRVIQEFLNNTRKHAAATEVIIQFSSDGQQCNIYLEDDGAGFNANDINLDRGLGLKSMESRVKFLEGTFELNSTPGVGTTVQINIPQKV